MNSANVKKHMLIAEDAFIADAQFAIHNLLAAKRVSRAELARRMEVSDPYVSQLFNDDTRNLTLRTVARIFQALGEEPQLTSETLEKLTLRSGNLEARASSRCTDDEIAMLFQCVTTNQFRLECNDNELEDELVAA